MALRRPENRGLREASVHALLRGGAPRKRFFHAMTFRAGPPQCDTSALVFSMKYLHWMLNRGGYDKYRQIRTSVALAGVRARLWWPFLALPPPRTLGTGS